MTENATDILKLPRWTKIIDRMLDPDQPHLSHGKMAELLGVSYATIQRDMNDPDFQKLLDKMLRSRINTDALSMAFKNIFDEIKNGDHKSKIKTSKWLIEQLRYLLPDTLKLPSNPEEPIDGEFQEVDTSGHLSNDAAERFIESVNQLRKFSENGN